jgi:autotransporter-associated beta strand protein
VKSIANINTGSGALANSAVDIGTGHLILDDETGEVSLYEGVMFSSSTGKITKNGGGQFNIGATNSAWDGELQVNEGTIGFRFNNSLGTTSSSTARLTLNGGTISNYNGTSISLQTQNVDITNSFSALVTSSNMQLLGTGSGGIGSVAITLKVDNPTITVNNTTGASGTFIFNGPVAEEGLNRGFTKAGPGQLTLAHPTNTFKGDVTILEGRLAVNANGGVGDGTGAIIFSGGNFSVSQAGRTLVIANPLNINAANAGIVSSANAANPVLEFSSAAIGGTGSLRVAHEGTACNTPFQGNMCIFDATFSAAGLNFTLPLEIDTGSTYGNGNISVARFNSGNATGTQTYSGVISGDGRFRRSAAGGTTTLTAANTYSGGTEVEGGTLTVSGASATLGTGDVTVTGGTLSILSGVANAIADTAALSISGTGLVNLGTGINDFIAGLSLGGVMQGTGTYGSSASSAANQFDQWFSGMGIVTVAAPGLAGDYNGDGKVDAADYVVWRKDPASFGGDPGGYNTWRANFGAMLGSGSGSAAATAVPEPASLGLLIIAIGSALIGLVRPSRRLK